MNQPLNALRKLMEERGIDIYVIPACDFHQSEYFCDHFWTTRYLSGFTGENATVVVTRDKALLWTDGRYFVQAEAQLEESFTLMRMNVKGVPTVREYLHEELPQGGCLGFDGRLLNYRLFRELKDKLADKEIRYAWEEDLADLIWPNRPPISPAPVFPLDIRYTGESTADKLARVRKKLEEEKADAHILTSLEDIAWLFNLRGDDIPYTPVFLSYALITWEKTQLFAFPEAFPEEVRAMLEADHIEFRPYDDILSAVSSLPHGSRVLMAENKVSMAMVGKLPEGCEPVYRENPTELMKAVKNETELACWHDCHVRDGVAMVRFVKWLKERIGKEEITEISAAKKMDDFRRELPLNHGLSFETISAYGPHAAMMHYTATPETDVPLEPSGFLLVDCGGHYLDGTSDITRTFVLGPITEEMKLHYTTVVRSVLNLSSAKFLTGCSGQSLDILARGPIWELGIDYRCGTGHGIGFMLSVHEGPQSFYFKPRPRGNTGTPLAPGMVITDEPGIYMDYHYGIRTEIELLVEKAEENEYGQFLKFRHTTFCPIDLDGIDVRYMTDRDIRLLNEYHALVYDTLKDHLTEEEAAWLKEATRPLSR